MAFTDGTGTEHPESFWTSGKYEINPLAKCARFEFVGFANEDAAKSGKAQLAEKIVVECDGEVYQRYMTRHLAEKIPINVLAYELADEHGKFPESKEV